VSIQSKQDLELQDCRDIGHGVKRVTKTHDVSKLTKGHNSNKITMTEEQACESTASKGKPEGPVSDHDLSKLGLEEMATEDAQGDELIGSLEELIIMWIDVDQC